MDMRKIIALVENVGRESVTGTAAFKQWFAGSQVVDERGQPQVVYHGTKSDFSVFTASSSGEFGPGIYLSANSGTADFYASCVASGEHGPNIVPLYASIQNPFHVTKQNWIKMTLRSTPRTVQKRLKARGHDGIFGVGLNGHDVQIVAFTPDQVKSAIANSGAFDAASHDIRETIV